VEEEIRRKRREGKARREDNELRKTEAKNPLWSLSLTLQQKSAVYKICFNQAILLEDSKYWKITIFI
jgi:hypothetical protein